MTKLIDISRHGIPSKVRGEVWKYLLGVSKPDKGECRHFQLFYTSSHRTFPRIISDHRIKILFQCFTQVIPLYFKPLHISTKNPHWGNVSLFPLFLILYSGESEKRKKSDTRLQRYRQNMYARHAQKHKKYDRTKILQIRILSAGESIYNSFYNTQNFPPNFSRKISECTQPEVQGRIVEIISAYVNYMTDVEYKWIFIEISRINDLSGSWCRTVRVWYHWLDR